ncbi:Zn-II 2Cys6 regulatory protein [Corynespora cassiicola Philippines]|uniref:Zn-II 2Cys6 regulatory protein n=1 Tax=Corynespora cassiicola Philippines TaxID=1448308 RepID=A0A2T2P5R2_CORCC|nr:Zn-II 2Cys6 regulatory protein [Corynespora cassiicola Philippines]
MFQAVPHTYTTTASTAPSIDAMAAMPPQNTMITSNPTDQPKPRKLRASCDACSRAKVKCDKVRPTCHRCGNMGICCNYSPSMRLGKPRKNRNPDGTIMRDVSPASSCGPLGPRPDMIPRTTSYTNESSPEPTDPFFFGPATPEYHYQDAFMTNSFEGGHSPYSESGSFVGGWANDDQLMFQSPSEMFPGVPQYPPPHSPYHGHVRSTSVQSQPEMFAPMDGIHSPPMQTPSYYGMSEQQPLPMFSPEKMASPPPMAQAPLPTPPTSATVQNHDCTQFAFQTLNSLYSPPASQPAASDFNGTSNGLPTLDSVLSTNKAAVDKLFVLLGCPCSENPHFSTTIAFTIVKILSWYQAVAGVNQPAGEAPINTQMEAFTHTPISLGDFRLEGEDEDTFRTQLVLGELRKVEKLIDKFSERYCKTTNQAETGIDGGVYGALETLLRTRVRDTFKVTMKSAPEEVKRSIASRTQQRARTNTIP